MVEMLTVAQSGHQQMASNSSYSSVSDGDSPSQASSGVAATATPYTGPEENRIPLIDNSPLLIQDTSSTKKFTSLTNEGMKQQHSC